MRATVTVEVSGLEQLFGSADPRPVAFAAAPEPAGVEGDPKPSGAIDPATILMLIELGRQLIEAIRRRRNG